MCEDVNREFNAEKAAPKPSPSLRRPESNREQPEPRSPGSSKVDPRLRERRLRAPDHG